jgi:phosphate-selective porin OprO/OprP
MNRVAALIACSTTCLWPMQAFATERAQDDLQQMLERRLVEQDQRIRELESRLNALLSAQAPVQLNTLSSTTARPSSVQTNKQSLTDAQAGGLKVRGRLQTDALLVNGDEHVGGVATQIRRFYLGVEGRSEDGFRYQAEADFAGGKVVLQDAFVGYQLNAQSELLAGHLKAPITADDMTSDVSTLFLERSNFSTIMAPGRRVGIAARSSFPNWGIRGAILGERDDSALDSVREESWLTALRVHTHGNIREHLLHYAVSGYYVAPSKSDIGASFSLRPETNRASQALATGLFKADHGVFTGGETAFQSGSFLLQFEGGVLNWDGKGTEQEFSGWSGQLSWIPTGESRPYDAQAGLFGRVEPRVPLNDGGLGAVEVGARMTHVQLDSGDLEDREMSTYGVVANWYPKKRWRVGVNAILARVSLNDRDDERAYLTARLAVDW